MGLSVFYTITFLITQLSRSQNMQLSTYAVIDNAQSDATATDDVLFEVKARSRLECTRHCVSVEKCTSFSYHKTAPEVTSCRGYTRKRMASSSTTQSQGPKSYTLKGPRCPVSGGFRQDSTSGMCYKAYYTRFNYSAALAVCKLQGAHFITLDTETKVRALLRGGLLRPGNYWIGLRCTANLENGTTKQSASDYSWTSTGQFVGSVNYFFPSVSFPDDCAACSFVDPGDFGWLTSPCDDSYENKILCEII